MGEYKKKRPSQENLNGALLIATDSYRKKPIAGALVTHENESETIFFLEALRAWLSKRVHFVTIDYSPQLESAIKKVYPNVLIQKCVFHSIHLLTKSFLKELNRLKREKFSHRIKEWNLLQGNSRNLEKGTESDCGLKLEYQDIKDAWNIYTRLRTIFSIKKPMEIKLELENFFLTEKFLQWSGTTGFLEKFRNIFKNRSGLSFTKKGVKYISTETYRAWRGAILQLRRKEELLNLHFNDVKYLLLMNPINMTHTHQKLLRRYLSIFPWLRSYRKVFVQFYYQFRLPPEKRSSLGFLSKLITKNSHSRLKSAVKTLIENREQIFLYQKVPCHITSVKSIKVVDESSNRLIQRLYFTQYGMRTIKNIRMRVSKKLNCPIIVSPQLLEKITTSSNIN